jgi:CRP/FNR family transcriptional regulator, cyclic AMP receptor protein
MTEIDFLRTISILRDLKDEELAAFRNLLTIQEAKTKERIIEEGTPVHHFYLVCDGTVHIRRLAQKREMLLGRLGPGSFFGEINLFDPGLASASIYAMKPTQLAVTSHANFREFMESNPAAGYKIVSAFMTELSRRFRQANTRLVQSVYWSNPAPGDS